jgi:tetrahydromethanopterin S-methyltransferase subunit G
MFVKGSNPTPVIGLRRSLATSEAAFGGPHGANPEWTAPMFEENAVLTQIKALRQEVGSRLDDMDQRLQKIEAELSSPAMQGFGSRLDEVDRRLQRVESEMSAPPAVNADAAQPAAFLREPQVRQVAPAPQVPTHKIKMTISPLTDVAHVSVVEAALRAIVGVEAVTLQSLKGDGAELEVDVQEDVSLIGGLRRTLPVAFDVNDADNSSFTLSLVQPAADTRGDAVVQKTL